MIAEMAMPVPEKPSSAVAATESMVKKKRIPFPFAGIIRSCTQHRRNEGNKQHGEADPGPPENVSKGSPLQITFLKYRGKANVTIMTLNEVLAKSNSSHENTLCFWVTIFRIYPVTAGRRCCRKPIRKAAVRRPTRAAVHWPFRGAACEPQHIALPVDNAGDVADGTVGIRSGSDVSIRVTLTESDLVVVLKPPDNLGRSEVVALHRAQSARKAPLPAGRDR